MAKPTHDHAEILRWAREQDAVPAEITPIVFDGEPGILHFLFGKEKAGTPEVRPISWESFFARFDLLKLAVVMDAVSARFEIVRVEKHEDRELSH